jgi:hypothetical protein
MARFVSLLGQTPHIGRSPTHPPLVDLMVACGTDRIGGDVVVSERSRMPARLLIILGFGFYVQNSGAIRTVQLWSV